MRHSACALAAIVFLTTGCISERRPGREGGVLPELSSDASTLFVPVVLSSSGSGGSFFTSEMTLTNRGTSAANVSFTYTAASGGGTGTGSDVLPAGTQKVVPDAIEYLRSRGVPIPASGNRVGTLTVAFSGLSSRSAGAVTVRTTTPVPVGAPTGRAGLAYAGVPAYQLLYDKAWLCGLRQTSADRTNVAIQNAGGASDGDVRIRLTYVAGDGGASGVQEQTLSPGGFFQYKLTDIAPAAANGYVKVERVSGTAPWYAYAVINDNVNSDGSFVTPLVESALVGRRGLTLPVVVETSTYTTEVILTNFSGGARQVTLSYTASPITAPNATASVTVSLSAGEQRIIPSFVQFLRDQGAAGVPAAGPTFTGSVTATVSAADVQGLALGARTSNPGGGGRYGLFYLARPFGTAVAASEAWLYGLQQNAENRTNLALLSAGEVDGNPITLRVELFDGSNGQKVATIEGGATTLAAHGFTQIGTVLTAYAPGVSQGYARVTRTSGANGFVAYAVVNDGGNPGERSGDGAFVSMSVDTLLYALFSGQWNNTTFGSSGPASLVITGDLYTQLYSGTATTGGAVFGIGAPPPQTYTDVFTLAGGTYSSQSDFYGKATTTVSSSGGISGSLSDIQSPNVSGTTFSGTIVPPTLDAQTITINSTIALRPSGTAQCVLTLQRQN